MVFRLRRWLLLLQGGLLSRALTTVRRRTRVAARGRPRLAAAAHPEDAPRDAGEARRARRLLRGKHTWLGGATDPHGCVYGVPSHSGHVICLAPRGATGEYDSHFLALPSAIADGADGADGGRRRAHQFKWLRGIVAGGTLYGIPAWSRAGVLAVDLDGWRRWRDAHPDRAVADDAALSAALAAVLPLPAGRAPCEGPQRWLWHGACLNRNATAIYCVPSNARDVLKVDLASRTTSYLAVPPRPGASAEEHARLLGRTNKFYGAVLGDDDACYGIPYAAGSVLRVDAATDAVALLGDLGWNAYNFHGGIKAAGGAIYAFPAHADRVLRIDTRPGRAADDDEARLALLPIARAPYDADPVRRYQWLGGALGADGNVYGMPSDAAAVLRIDVETDAVVTFGRVESAVEGYREKNQWQGGVLGGDGHVYAVPSDARSVLRIDTRPLRADEGAGPARGRVTRVGDLPGTKDKYQGGFLDRQGAILAIPENADVVLKVRPPQNDGTETVQISVL